MSAISKTLLTENHIAQRAYEIYLDGGSKNGRDIDDWLVAEKELSERNSSPPQKARTAAAGQGHSASVTKQTDGGSLRVATPESKIAVTTKDSVVRETSVAAYTVPTDFPESDGTLERDKTTLVLVNASAGDKVGIGYTYAGLKKEREHPIYCKLQLVTDYVAGMTDTFACHMHKDLSNV
jgi:hypothetical protein